MSGLADQIRHARARYAAGDEGAVLDILRTQATAAEVTPAALRDEGGVGLLQDEAVADFSRWSRERARAARCVTLRDGPQWVLAAEDPWDEGVVQQVRRAVGEPMKIVAIERARLTTWLDAAPGSLDAERRGSTRPGELGSNSPPDSRVVQFVDDALGAAGRLSASDVHFECDRSGVSAKHRIDGILVPFARLEGDQAAQEVISRIKVLAMLDITERRLPQDGRLRASLDDADVDVRVSIVPSVHGEDAVLRILDKARLRGEGTSVTLAALGFDVAAAKTIRELSTRPSGLLLVTGPTGSGKTTTLYAALTEINSGIEKIITIEDPVEYELDGVLQVPVNERKGLTFAKGLRSVLRHDPDRILVGEIRDAETAGIAVQSALTGHTVFTTVHANSVGDVVGRFRHFGIDMFGFMSSLNGVVVQRLLRRLCDGCAQWSTPPSEDGDWLSRVGAVPVSRLRYAVGCSACRGTGYRGRFVIAEIHLVDDTLRDGVAAGVPLSTIKAHAQACGVPSLEGQALARVLGGDTTVAEVRRTVG
jgi:general secretion pathway protein E